VPSPDNPKTSYLAALSVIQTIKEMVERGLKVGT
jgi:predicted dinucleotide-utilizing enzyme